MASENYFQPERTSTRRVCCRGSVACKHASTAASFAPGLGQPLPQATPASSVAGTPRLHLLADMPFGFSFTAFRDGALPTARARAPCTAAAGMRYKGGSARARTMAAMRVMRTSCACSADNQVDSHRDRPPTVRHPLLDATGNMEICSMQRATCIGNMHARCNVRRLPPAELGGVLWVPRRCCKLHLSCCMLHIDTLHAACCVLLPDPALFPTAWLCSACFSLIRVPL